MVRLIGGAAEVAITGRATLTLVMTALKFLFLGLTVGLLVFHLLGHNRAEIQGG